MDGMTHSTVLILASSAAGVRGSDANDTPANKAAATEAMNFILTIYQLFED